MAADMMIVTENEVPTWNLEDGYNNENYNESYPGT